MRLWSPDEVRAENKFSEPPQPFEWHQMVIPGDPAIPSRQHAETWSMAFRDPGTVIGVVVAPGRWDKFVIEGLELVCRGRNIVHLSQ